MPGAPSPSTPTESEVVDAICQVVTQELGLPSGVRADTRLGVDLALDSLALLTLVVALEDRFRVILDDAEAAQLRTVGQLAAWVVRASKGRP